LRTGAFALAQEGVKSKQETLLASFGTSFHPLSLSHEWDFVEHWQVSIFWLLFDLNNFLLPVLGEKYSYLDMSI
jgi:hypothetical protein